MPKGGARKKSDDFPIGKGMLQNEFWETLCFAADRKSFSPDNVREYFTDKIINAHGGYSRDFRIPPLKKKIPNFQLRKFCYHTVSWN